MGPSRFNVDRYKNFLHEADNVPVMVVQKVGCLAEVTRLDSDHAHVELGQLQPEDITEARDGVLGGGVHAEAGVWVAGGHAGHIDQPPPGLFEERQTVFGHIETSNQVGAHLVLHLVQSLPVKLSTNTDLSWKLAVISQENEPE